MARTEAQKIARKIKDATPEARARAKAIADKSRAKRRDKLREAQRLYREEHREELAEKQKIYWNIPKNKERQARLQKEKIANNQIFATCLICEMKTKLVWDHDHETGIFREYICSSCNSMLGFAQDSVTILVNAINYLNKYRYVYYETPIKDRLSKFVYHRDRKIHEPELRKKRNEGG